MQALLALPPLSEDADSDMGCEESMLTSFCRPDGPGEEKAHGDQRKKHGSFGPLSNGKNILHLHKHVLPPHGFTMTGDCRQVEQDPALPHLNAGKNLEPQTPSRTEHLSAHRNRVSVQRRSSFSARTITCSVSCDAPHRTECCLERRGSRGHVRVGRDLLPHAIALDFHRVGCRPSKLRHHRWRRLLLARQEAHVVVVLLTAQRQREA